jgi:hypothetical protein
MRYVLCPLLLLLLSVAAEAQGLTSMPSLVPALRPFHDAFDEQLLLEKIRRVPRPTARYAEVREGEAAKVYWRQRLQQDP